MKKEVIFLIIILIIAGFFRLWQLDKIPPGLYPDVAINGNDAINSLKSGNFKVFYPDNFGREGLFIWLIALSFSIFGVSIWSIKIVAAIIGILTVFGLYLLTKEVLHSEKIALLSSFFLATSFWHTNFSRIGFRAILLPFILVFVFYFLVKGFRTKIVYNFIIAGIFFGIGFYTYISYRFIVFLLPIILLCWFFIYRKQNLQKKYLLSIFYFLFSIFIIALPIGLYFLQNPQDFVGRATPISIFSTENPLKEFGKSLILHLGMFNFYGDPNWRHNFADSPLLPWPLGILFLIGLFYSLYNLIQKKNVACHLLLVAWFLIMLLPGILTYEGIPHALRTIGVIPVVYIFVGLGGWWCHQKLFLACPVSNRRFWCGVFCFLFLVFIGLSEFNKYFIKWAENPNTKGAFTQRLFEIGNYLNSLPAEVKKYVIVNESGVPVPWPDGIPMPAQTPMFIQATSNKGQETTYLLPENLGQIQIEKEIVILPMEYEERLFEEFSQKWENKGNIKKINEIVIYEIK